MTDAFRQKLLNWITSAALCLGYLALAPLIGFYVNSEVVFRLTDPDMILYRDGTVAMVLSSVIVVFVATALTMIIWHASDMTQRGKPQHTLLGALVSYRLIVGITLITICGTLIIHSGVLASVHCPASDPQNNVYVFCTPNPSRGFIPLVFLPWCLMSVVTLVKSAFAIVSRFR